MVNGGRAGYMGMGCGEAIYYRSTRYENMPGKYQGIIREKLCQSVGTLLAFPLVQFYGAGTVWSLLQVSHIYVNKPTRY